MADRKLTFERTLNASADDVWKLWTTKEGLESWWGPEGFTTEVSRLDLRAGGGYEYTMRASAPAQIEGMKAAGLPLESVARGSYTEVNAPRRVVYTTVVDFIPNAQPYTVSTIVEIQPTESGARLLVTEDAMHDEQWTRMSEMGMNASLDKLVKVLEARRR